tara:strand:- start:3941 stop:4291 length:351 start_codon:yes stop_codon:yes gene_type:complete
MKEFIENQQYREDQLRYQCSLENHVIKPKKSNYEIIIDDISMYFKNIHSNYPKLNDSPIVIHSYNEFMKESLKNENINRRIIYNDDIYVLKITDPLHWSLELNDLSLDISKITILQ